MWPLLGSVLFGAMAAVAPFFAITAPLAIMVLNEPARELPVLILLPLAVAFVSILSCSLLIGLPLTAFLARHRRESAVAYVSIGMIVGGILSAFPPTLVDAGIGLWLLVPLSGVLGGGVTGWTWWRGARRPALRAQGVIA